MVDFCLQERVQLQRQVVDRHARNEAHAVLGIKPAPLCLLLLGEGIVQRLVEVL